MSEQTLRAHLEAIRDRHLPYDPARGIDFDLADVVAALNLLAEAASEVAWQSDPDPECAQDFGDDCTPLWIDYEPATRGSDKNPGCCCGKPMRNSIVVRLIPDPPVGSSVRDTTTKETTT